MATVHTVTVYCDFCGKEIDYARRPATGNTITIGKRAAKLACGTCMTATELFWKTLCCQEDKTTSGAQFSLWERFKAGVSVPFYGDCL